MRSWFKWEFNWQFLIHLLLGKIRCVSNVGRVREHREGPAITQHTPLPGQSAATPSLREGKTYVWHGWSQTLWGSFSVIGKRCEHLSVDDGCVSAWGRVFQFAGAALTKYHALRGSNSRTVLSQVMKAGSCTMKMLQGFWTVSSPLYEKEKPSPWTGDRGATNQELPGGGVVSE